MQKSERKNLRSSILQQRANLSEQEQLQNSLAITNRLTKLLVFLRSQRIALYFSNKGEVDTSLILQKATALSKQCYFPILHPTKQNQLWFGEYHSNYPLKKNCFGILEPDLDLTKKISPRDLDLVIAPLVAFDNVGNRLGMGGGFYDRTFAFLQEQTSQKPVLIGLAYEFQHLDTLEVQSWDVPLQMVITEKQIYNFKVLNSE